MIEATGWKLDYVMNGISLPALTTILRAAGEISEDRQREMKKDGSGSEEVAGIDGLDCFEGNFETLKL